MVTTGPPPLTILQPGEGNTGELLGFGVAFKLWGRDTNGQVSVVEHPLPVGALVLPHLHTREDEYSIVTEGEIGFRSGDREAVLGAGGYITKPRGRCTRCGTPATCPHA
jgi:quercetin dioxygenase-like cupin family protein